MLQLKHLKQPSIVNNLILTALLSNLHVNFTPKIMVFQLLFCDRIIKLMAMSVLFHPLSPWFFVWFFTLLLLFFLPIPPQPTPRQGNQMAGDQGWPCDELECSSIINALTTFLKVRSGLNVWLLIWFSFNAKTNIDKFALTVFWKEWAQESV